jgi:hypothetical protein
METALRLYSAEGTSGVSQPAPSQVTEPAPHQPGPRTELLLTALKMALTNPGEHRLFRSGKLAGLFPSRAGLGAEAALIALQEGLLETVRTETRGRIIVEWVRATPRAVQFIHHHDSPQSALRELRELLATTQAGVPVWMAEAKQEVAKLSAQFEERAAALLTQLSDLALRVEAALRRAEASGLWVAEPVGRLVPWAVDVLEYLDRRKTAGATADCPLPELFHAVRTQYAQLTLPEFHDGLRRLHDVRALRLIPGREVSEPEYALLVDGQLMYAVNR